MRIFIALDLPDPLLDQLTALQAGLPAGAPSKRETLHLTLAFAGDHPQERVEALHDELSLVNAPAFEVQLSGLGTFGKSSPTLLYAGVAENPALGEYLAMHEGFTPPAFSVTSFVLFQSTLHPQGARHDALARYPLAWS